MNTKRNAKLTPEQVVQIRDLYWQHKWTQRALCRQFNVSVMTIGRIVRGETWQDNGGPGYHNAASEPPVEQALRHAAEDAIAVQNAPPASAAEVQASLAKLATLIEKGRGDGQRDGGQEDEIEKDEADNRQG